MKNQRIAFCSVVTVYRNIRLGSMSHGGKKLRINFGKKHEFELRTLLNFDSSDIQKLYVPAK